MRFDIVTLFPRMFDGYLGQSLLHKAIQKKIVEVELHDLRNWSQDKHQSVDDRPYGGGPGMVIRVEPVVECVEELQRSAGTGTGPAQRGPERAELPGHVVLLTPQGRRLDQQAVERLAGHRRLILLCGRYEGFDQRVSDILQPEEISIGDYIINGGEVAAMVIVDAVIRWVPGVLGDEQSSLNDSFSCGHRWLESEQYTRPRDYRGYAVPEVLLSGDHGRIAAWRHERSLSRTQTRRSDLLPPPDPAAAADD